MFKIFIFFIFFNYKKYEYRDKGKYADLEENSLAKRIATFLEKLNINKDVKEISLDKCIKIIGEIRKAVNESKDTAITLKNVEPSEKAQKIYEITIELLSTSVIKEKLSPEVNTQIQKYIDNKELVETIGELVEWGSDMILDSYDNNKDGIVTIDEISDDVVSCCMCKTNRNPEGCAYCTDKMDVVDAVPSVLNHLVYVKVNFSQIFYAVDVDQIK